MASEGDESTKYSQSPSAGDRLHAQFRNKLRKCVKNALKKHDVFVVNKRYLMSCCWQEKAMRARSILNRRAQTTGSTHNIEINCANVCKKLCTH